MNELMFSDQLHHSDWLVKFMHYRELAVGKRCEKRLPIFPVTKLSIFRRPSKIQQFLLTFAELSTFWDMLTQHQARF